MMHKKKFSSLMRAVLLGSGFSLLAACGGDYSVGEKPQEAGDEPVIVALVQGNETEVYEGDEVVDPEGSARIRVRHESSDDRKFVTLLSGSANLVRHSGGEG